MKHLHIGGFTGCGGRNLRDLITISRSKRAEFKVVRADADLNFDDWVNAREPDDLVLCGFDRPAVAIAAALDRGDPVETAIKLWIEEAATTLALAAQSPSAFIVVNVSEAFADPNAFARLIAARTCLKLGAANPRTAPAASVVLHLDLARRLVDWRPDLSDMVEELSATALLDGAFEPSPAQVSEALGAAREARAGQARALAALESTALALSRKGALIGELRHTLEESDFGAVPGAEHLRDAVGLVLERLQEAEEELAAARRTELESITALEAHLEAASNSGAVNPVDTGLIAEIVELASEEIRRADGEVAALQNALKLCSKEAERGNEVTRPDDGAGPDFAEIAVAAPSEGRRLEGLSSSTALSPKVQEILQNPLALMRDYVVVRCSRLFDGKWYLKRYTDLQGVRDPALHFVIHGAREGRASSAYFSGYQYTVEYADVARSGANPLVHYLLTGRKEGRRIFPVIDEFNYDARRGDL